MKIARRSIWPSGPDFFTKQLLRIMNLTGILLLATFLQLSATGLSQKVTFSGRNVTVQHVFKEVIKQTGISIIYSEKDLKSLQPIDIDVKEATVEEVLSICLKNQTLSYSLEGNIITVIPSTGGVNPGLGSDDFSRRFLPRPPITVRGRIINEKGEPVVASVTIKGTKRGTTTDAYGFFEILNVEEDAVLIISATNIVMQEVKVNGRSEFSIRVRSSASDLDAVVVNKGYYTEKQIYNTGNVSKVSSAEISKQPVTNPLQALIGRMPGVYINQRNGFAGGQIDIQIRGQNSLRTAVNDDGNAPFYIVDGVPFTSTPLSSPVNFGPIPDANPLNNINLSDIENIEVLKDADATAIYGSRGSNGVVLITTKKGKAGKTKADINFSTGIGKVNRMIDVLNTEKYLEMRNEALKSDDFMQYLTPGFEHYFRDLMIWDTTRDTNWQNELIGGTSNVTNAQASFSGGNTNTQFLFGGSYYKETTVFPEDFNFKKGSGHFNLTHETSDKKFSASLTTSYSANNNHLPFEDFTTKSISLPPTAPSIYNEDRTLNWSGWYNQFASLKNKYQAQSENLITNVSLSYEIIPGLRVKSSLGYTVMRNEELQTSTFAAQNPAFTDNEASAFFANSSIKTWVIEPQVSYQRKISQGNLNVLLGTTIQENIREGKTLRASGFVNDALIENIDAASSVTISSANYSQYRYSALFGRINYIWDSKYLINLTGRRDGSSRFGTNKQFANFGAVGLAWIFSNEGFAKNNLSLLSFGKLRGSYGITGSDQIPGYGYLDSYSTTQYPYENGTGLVPVQLSNAEFSWETNKKLEAALELGFVNDRILFSASWYRNRSSNQLVGYSLSTVTGFSSVQYNLPAVVQNTGWEFELTSININRGHLKWTTSLNFTIPQNKLVAFPDIENSSYANSKVVGKSLGIINTYHSTGVDPETGAYTFEDVDGDGQITHPNDKRAIVIAGQKFYGGLQNMFQYKGFQLDVFFQFVKQTGINYLNGPFPAPGLYNPFTYQGNQPTVVMDRWQKPGDETNIQKFSGGLFGSEAQTAYDIEGDLIYSNASFIRLKNVSLSWQLPSNWVLQGSKVYLQGQNLFTSTKYLGDPEILTGYTLPPLRMITAGIQLTF